MRRLRVTKPNGVGKETSHTSPPSTCQWLCSNYVTWKLAEYCVVQLIPALGSRNQGIIN